MDLHEIKTLIDAMSASDLAEMEISKDGWTLRLVRDRKVGASSTGPAGPIEAEALGSLDGTRQTSANAPVCAPLFGTVHLSPSPSEPAFVQVGQAVSAGATLCVIEAMKVMNAVQAERDGIVEAIFVASGDQVEAGQPLVQIV
jgi:acetyl-CoA carboxylase biotin carboxyl carrier protein